jgi:hypothetical protein
MARISCGLLAATLPGCSSGDESAANVDEALHHRRAGGGQDAGAGPDATPSGQDSGTKGQDAGAREPDSGIDGSGGIAAHYPHDVGIKNDPAVVFADDFETASGTVLGEGSLWTTVYGKIGIVKDPALVHAGAQAVDILHDAAPQGIGAYHKVQTEGYDTLYVRYYMKYDPAYPGQHHQGLEIFAGAPGITSGATAGVKPNGTDHYQARFDNNDPNFSWALAGDYSPGYLNSYTYHMDQGSQWGDLFFPTGTVLPSGKNFGPTFVSRPNVIPDLNRWYCFEIMLHANTPGLTDGRVTLWMDGAIVGDFPNIRFRTVDTLKPNTIVLDSYVDTLRPNEHLWYDDIVAATSYIGPMVP